jgi:hypothetical protein
MLLVSKASGISVSFPLVEVIVSSFIRVDLLQINDDLDLLFVPEILSQRKTYAPRAPPRFASRGLLIAPRSARLLTNSGIYRKDGALSLT